MTPKHSFLLLIPLLCSCSLTPSVGIRADGAFTGRNIEQLQDGPREYGDLEDLRNVALSFPPPITTIKLPPLPGDPPPDFYQDLLDLLHTGPGGTAITLEHLYELTPTFLAIAPLIQQDIQSFLNSPLALVALAELRSVMEPLGLWNNDSLNFIIANQLQLTAILTQLYDDLIAWEPDLIKQPDIKTPVDVIGILNKLADLLDTDDWLLIAERGPSLIHKLIKHVGFSRPQIVLYADRDGYYRAGIQTERYVDGEREIHRFNQSGYVRDDNASGAGRYYQGRDDVSLTYIPVEVQDGEVETLDLVSSDMYALFKRWSGGDTRLLNRTRTFNNGLLSVDVDLSDYFSVHGGTGATAYSSFSGAFGELKYGTGLFTGRIAAGFVHEQPFGFSDEKQIVYAETENTLSTPSLEISNVISDTSASMWLSTTLAASGLTMRRLNTAMRGMQGDARVIPEWHGLVQSPYFTASAVVGGTAAVVPAGPVDLDEPSKSLQLRFIRTHIGGEFVFNIGQMFHMDALSEHKRGVEANLKEWWTDKEKAAYLAKFKEPDRANRIAIAFGTMTEVSKLVEATRLTLDFIYDELRVGSIVEVERYKDSSFTDVRLGGSFAYKFVRVAGVKSIEDNDYQISAGVDLLAYSSD